LHARPGALLARAAARGSKKVVVHPNVEGGRALRELEIIGLSQPEHVPVRLSERAGKGPARHSSRSIRVI
jgi:hypothetical protein